mgnify:CR=1 FL=1
MKLVNLFVILVDTRIMFEKFGNNYVNSINIFIPFTVINYNLTKSNFIRYSTKNIRS